MASDRPVSTPSSSRPAWTRPRATPEAEATFLLTVNGEQCRVSCRADTPVLYLLRNDLALKGSRFGCGLAQCGACMVLFDGCPTPSCDLPVWAAEGHEIRTIEGLAGDPVMQALQGAFLEHQAAQCGYCMSGILVSACALLHADPQPEQAGITEALDRNLCRCGSHGRVLRAVHDAAAALRERAVTAQTTQPPPEGGPAGTDSRPERRSET